MKSTVPAISSGRLPLSFVVNTGQTNRQVRYYARGPGYAFYATRTGLMVTLVKEKRVTSVALDFVGAVKAATVQARGRLPGKVNYLVGSDRTKWRTGLSTYREIVYRGLWPGIDMAIRGSNGTLKYEFLVRPGARVQDIRLAYRGAKSLSVSPGGALLIGTPLGTLEDSAPTSYQRIDGRRVAVPSRFLVGESRGYGFALGPQDVRYPLVIDPGLVYSTYLGGVGVDIGQGVDVDEAGNAYVAGTAFGSTFPTTPGAYRTTAPGDFDAFVAKLNRTGSALVYSTYLGGSAFDFANGSTIDGDGNAYVVGYTESSDFPTTAEAFQAADPDPTPGVTGGEGFVTKLNRSGSALAYSTYLGGTSGSVQDSINTVAVDRKGSAYVAGSVCSPNYPTTPKAFQPVDPMPVPCDPEDPRPAGNTAVVSKLDPAGSALVYSTYLGGKSFDNVNGMTIDREGSVYVTGPADGDFPTTKKAFQEADPAPGTDAFVTKLNESGSKLEYSTYLGGSSDDEGGLGIGVDDKGFAYVAGRTGSADFPTTPGAYDRTLSGVDDAFVAKLDKPGSSLVYSTLLGGSGLEEPHFSVAVGEDGSAYVPGTTGSTDFPTTPGAPQPVYGGGSLDGFVTVVNASGSGLAVSTYLGGSGRDIANNIALDEDDAFYVVGSTRSSDFPTTPGVFQATHGGGVDGFVTKLDLGIAQ